MRNVLISHAKEQWKVNRLKLLSELDRLTDEHCKPCPLVNRNCETCIINHQIRNIGIQIETGKDVVDVAAVKERNERILTELLDGKKRILNYQGDK